jgi:hypothetical protein
MRATSLNIFGLGVLEFLSCVVRPIRSSTGVGIREKPDLPPVQPKILQHAGIDFSKVLQCTTPTMADNDRLKKEADGRLNPAQSCARKASHKRPLGPTRCKIVVDPTIDP